jgi:hypothetical protein
MSRIRALIRNWKVCDGTLTDDGIEELTDMIRAARITNKT